MAPSVYGRFAPVPSDDYANIRSMAGPPYAQLVRELEETNFLAVGRKYGVSDNAIRKWVRSYERERERERERLASA